MLRGLQNLIPVDLGGDDDKEYRQTVEKIARRHAPAAGIIIVFVPEDDQKAMRYWHHQGLSFHTFGVETEPEDPKTYYKFSAAKKKTLELAEHWQFSEADPDATKDMPDEEKFLMKDYPRKEIPGHLMLCLWCHPDSGIPLDQYKVMSQGHRFPGSPRK